MKNSKICVTFLKYYHLKQKLFHLLGLELILNVDPVEGLILQVFLRIFQLPYTRNYFSIKPEP